jgi:hypothetical protein
MSEEEMSFEEFNKLIDESHDEGCGCCFSFHHYQPLDPTLRKIAYLGFIDSKEEYYKSILEELDKREDQEVDENIYWLVCGCEMCETDDVELRDNLMSHVMKRANEMIHKKMPTAWVAVRAYAWMKDSDPVGLLAFLDECEAVEFHNLDVWKVVLGNIRWDVPAKEKSFSRPGQSSLSLAYMKRKAYSYALKAIELGDDVESYVAAVNAVRGLASLQDPRVVEIMDKLPRHSLDRTIKEDALRQIEYLKKNNELDFIPVLEQVISRCQTKL